jgi:type II secretory pathway component PulJ
MVAALEADKRQLVASWDKTAAISKENAALRERVRELESLQRRVKVLEAERAEAEAFKAKAVAEKGEYELLRARAEEVKSLRDMVEILEAENRELEAYKTSNALSETTEDEDLRAQVKELESLRAKVAALEADNSDLEAFKEKAVAGNVQYEQLLTRVKELEPVQAKIAVLEAENKELRAFKTKAEPRELETRPVQLPRSGPSVVLSRRHLYLGVSLVAFGVLTLLFGAVTGTGNLAGLGLASFLIGLLVLYLPSRPAVPPELVEASALSSLANLERVLRELGPGTKALYLKTQDRLQVPMVLLSLSDNPALVMEPKPLDADRLLLVDSDDPQRSGLLLQAPGASFLAVMEKESGVDFFDVETQDLIPTLKSCMVESLEAAADLKGELTGAGVRFMMKDGMLGDFSRSVAGSAPTVLKRVGCPLCSAGICAAVKVLKRDLIVERVEHESGEHTVTLRYR